MQQAEEVAETTRGTQEEATVAEATSEPPLAVADDEERVPAIHAQPVRHAPTTQS